VTQAAGTLKAQPAELNNRIAQVLDQVKSLEKELAAAKGKLASAQGDELMTQAVDGQGRETAWWPSWKVQMPKPCATPWTSSKTSSKQP
jgi:alanyl-tRNA synthetase